MTALRVERVETPLGEAHVVWSGDAVVALDWADCASRLHGWLDHRYGTWSTEPAPAGQATAALDAYFGGALDALNELPVDAGGTDFQGQVWTALRAIPAGTTTTYSGIAASLERPGADRAVGAANGRNPISLVLPCHRVIGAGGELRGYAGGVRRKRWLLAHEGVAVPAEQVGLFGSPSP
ncbi:MAG: methylated-DNA--[protein]-cysteine S-methyltransferase [Deltaproteobacteria bacterium]|nr:methylated-DNA--[protein]-cysteine S-methyltransferase [Deltaproteobacteria bacterium]